MKILRAVAMAFFSLTFASPIFADEAYDIIKKQSTMPYPNTSRTVLILTNIDRNGSTEIEQIYQYGRDNKGVVDTVFDIKSPANIKGTRVLQQGKGSREDDRWIYMPNLRQVRRISMSDRSKQFVGCEFTYNDMAIRDVNEDKHEMLSKDVQIEVPGGRKYNCWKIKSTPYKKSHVEYAYRIQYIDKETYLPAKIEYFDKKNSEKLMKTYTTEDWKYITTGLGNKYVLRSKVRIVNHVTGRQTTIDVKDPIWEEKLTPTYFTQQYLQTGKAK